MLINVVYWEFPNGDQTAFAEVKPGLYRCFQNRISPSSTKYEFREDCFFVIPPANQKDIKKAINRIRKKVDADNDGIEIVFKRSSKTKSTEYITVNDDNRLLGSSISCKELSKKFEIQLKECGYNPLEGKIKIARPITFISKQFPQEWAFCTAYSKKILNEVEEKANEELKYVDHRNWPALFLIKWRWAFLKRSKKYRSECDRLWNKKVSDIIEYVWLYGQSDVEEFLLSSDIRGLREFGYAWGFFGLTLSEMLFFLDYEKTFNDWIAALIYFQTKSYFTIAKGRTTLGFNMKKEGKWKNYDEIFNPKKDLQTVIIIVKEYLKTMAEKIMRLGDATLFPTPLITFDVHQEVNYNRLGMRWTPKPEQLQC